MLKQLNLFQIYTLIILAAILAAGLFIFFRQIYKQRRLMKRKQEDSDIREQNQKPWPKIFQTTNHK